MEYECMSNEIDETNYRKCAKDAIKRYSEIGMIVDMIFWSKIIGLYEKELIKK